MKRIRITGGRVIDPASGYDEKADVALVDTAVVAIKTIASNFTPDTVIDATGCIVMHPGPINRGVEIDSAVVDGQQSVILPQVTFGIAVRMAVMSIVAGNES